MNTREIEKNSLYTVELNYELKEQVINNKLIELNRVIKKNLKNKKLVVLVIDCN